MLKNGDLTPRDVNKTSRRSCWFTCDVCCHDFHVNNTYDIIKK